MGHRSTKEDDFPPYTGLYSGDRIADRTRGEVRQLRAALTESEAENDQWQKKLAETWAENERLRAALALLHAALQDVVSSTGGRLIVQDYERLNEALAGHKDG